MLNQYLITFIQLTHGICKIKKLISSALSFLKKKILFTPLSTGKAVY